MTFGEVKTIIEDSIFDSYKEPKNFKKVMNEFHQNVLTNKSISKLYVLYDDLTSEKGLSESDAKDYLQEGIDIVKEILSSSKLPKFTSKKSNNKYRDLDNLVYLSNLNINERLNSRKNLINNLMKSPVQIKESINLPVSTMVSVANQTLSKYVENMDESTKKDFFRILKSDEKELQSDFTKIKESAISKLENILTSESENDLKTKITETIEKLKNEEFSQMNYIRLSSLEKSI